MPDGASGKAEWRSWARSIPRAHLSPQVVGHLTAWPPIHGAVLTYLAMAHEVDVAQATAGERCRVLVPRTEPDGGLSVHDLDPDSLVSHRFGFREPSPESSPVPLDEVDVVLVPGLVFDRAGYRIGHGAGMYDRLLGSLSLGVVRVGITVDEVFVDRVPAEPHDRAVDWVATESGIHRVGSALGPSSESVVRAGIERGLAAGMVHFPAGTKTSRDAAAAVGCDLGAIAKSLVFLVDDRPVVVICSGDRRVDETKLAQALGGRIARPAPLEAVREVTGFVAGGTPA
ncbi:MAG TPA: 5-formyltetrahydrofolate cyclo-ligase, partial [Acidimicrobiia bacterium]|nr:5-formyltetrahydrofolate cyclo-ligase [Acidimicrobiia bacterium]